jgi:hypothetical protein
MERASIDICYTAHHQQLISFADTIPPPQPQPERLGLRVDARSELYMDSRGDPNASHKKREKSKINVPSRRVAGPLFDRWESIRHRVFSSNDSADRVGG